MTRGVAHRTFIVGFWLGVLLCAGPAVADLIADGNHYWHPNTPPREEGSHFGWAVATGDFDGDGYKDLAIGAPWEDLGEARDLRDVGAVWVFYGSEHGVTNIGLQRLSQSEMGCGEEGERGSRFGAAVAAGDFDGDGYDDLAIGIPKLYFDSGAVMPVYGSASGLVPQCTYLWQNRDGDLDQELDDQHGSSLAVGDFDADGYADLAIGAFGETISKRGSNAVGAGAVNVLYGSRSGLESAGSQLWHQNSKGIKGRAGIFDGFGYSLAAGDFAGDGADDLAIGVPGECLKRAFACNTGVVQILQGRPGKGLGARDNQMWSENSLGSGAKAKREELFGWSLAAADFDGDGHDDLAVGAPKEKVRGHARAGAAHVLYGVGGEGLTASRSSTWRQSDVLLERPEARDRFGYSLTAGDFDDSGTDDLAIGAPREDLAGSKDVGVVHVLYSRSTGLTADGNQLWHQRREDVEGEAEVGDSFGSCAAAGDFDGNGADDLAVGVPYEEMRGFEDAGAVHVFYGIPILRPPW